MDNLPPLADNIVSLIDQIRASQAYQIDLRLSVLATNYYVFERNYQELGNLIDDAEHSASLFHIWEPEKKHMMQQVMREIARRLQNLVASAKSLIDHTRRLIREWYKCSDFMELYQAEIDRRFVNNPLAQFIEDLRDYCLHYRLPPVITTLHMDQLNPTPQRLVQLDRAELLRWQPGKWSPASREYLANSTAQIDLRSVCLQYYSEVRDFHIWMNAELERRHSVELEWLKRAITKYRELDNTQQRHRGHPSEY